jgi:hypothetical protein
MPKLTPEQRAAINRANGAKSRGPKTDAGRARCAAAARQASLRRAALSFDYTLLPSESRDAFNAIAAQEFAHWSPASPTEVQLVHELIDINWRITRLRYAQNAHLVALIDAQRTAAPTAVVSVALAAQAELDGTLGNGLQPQLDRRIDRLAASRSRIFRDLDRCKRRANSLVGSQPPLETLHLPNECAWQVPTGEGNPATPDPAPEPAPEQAPGLTCTADPVSLLVPPPEPDEVHQAAASPAPTEPSPVRESTRSAIGFTPDPFQAEFIASSARNIIVLGGRQTGKSTAAAVRKVYEAVHDTGSTLLLAAPPAASPGRSPKRPVPSSINSASKPAARPRAAAACASPTAAPSSPRPIGRPPPAASPPPGSSLLTKPSSPPTNSSSRSSPCSPSPTARSCCCPPRAGRSGFFSDQWHATDADWHRIQCHGADCARITPEALENMRRRRSPQEFAREFECVFTSEPDRFITGRLFDSAVRDDIEPRPPPIRRRLRQAGNLRPE